jgi:hypothetical protein
VQLDRKVLYNRQLKATREPSDCEKTFPYKIIPEKCSVEKTIRALEAIGERQIFKLPFHLNIPDTFTPLDIVSGLYLLLGK